jgi:hypothetical protein
MFTGPLFHIGGIHATGLAMLGAGRLVFLKGRFDPGQVLELIEREKLDVEVAPAFCFDSQAPLAGCPLMAGGASGRVPRRRLLHRQAKEEPRGLDHPGRRHRDGADGSHFRCAAERSSMSVISVAAAQLRQRRSGRPRLPNAWPSGGRAPGPGDRRGCAVLRSRGAAPGVAPPSSEPRREPFYVYKQAFKLIPEGPAVGDLRDQQGQSI